jgi:hypothetical protein
LEDLHGLSLHVDDELLDCVGKICVGKDLSEVKFLVVYDQVRLPQNLVYFLDLLSLPLLN